MSGLILIRHTRLIIFSRFRKCTLIIGAKFTITLDYLFDSNNIQLIHVV